MHTGEKEVEELSTHYAIMNAQEECVARPLPLAIVLYHVYLKAVHSGMSFEQILALDDVQFGQFGAEAMQIACSAGLFPYEKDFVPGIGLSFFHGLVLQAVPTEDMVSFFAASVCLRLADKLRLLAGLAAVVGAGGWQDHPRYWQNPGAQPHDDG